MKISIANVSEKINDDEFTRALLAMQCQVTEHFAPHWAVDITIQRAEVQRALKPTPEMLLSDAILYVGETNDDPQQVADAIGYHDQNHRGIPFGFVFTDVAEKVGEPWTATLSHEVLELGADPEVNRLVMAPHPLDGRRRCLLSYEVCDPTQSDTYKINGVVVSNFVTPRYFASLPRENRTQTNYLNLPLERFGCREGGYLSYLDLESREWREFYGSHAARERAEAKKILANARRVARRG